MTFRTGVFHVVATLFTASAILGIFTATGFPEPLPRQIFIALGTAIFSQTFVTWLKRSGRLTSMT